MNVTMTRRSVGERAYHLRRTLGLSWPQIAEQLGYRPDMDRAVRADYLINAAKKHAVRRGLAWPPTEARHA